MRDHTHGVDDKHDCSATPHVHLGGCVMAITQACPKICVLWLFLSEITPGIHSNHPGVLKSLKSWQSNTGDNSVPRSCA